MFTVLNEIEERRQFLEEMNALGRGSQYHHIINTEISQVIQSGYIFQLKIKKQSHHLLFNILHVFCDSSSHPSQSWEE